MRVAVCAIMKNNFKYIREWIDHYLSLGVDTIIIYDNNDIDDKRKIPETPAGKVIVINVRGVWNAQLPAFNECYKKFNQNFDWIGFFDSDEYLILNKWRNVKEMLHEFDENDLLAIEWLNYDDMGVIKRNERITVNKFFTRPAKKWNEFFHYKQFIRSGFNDIDIHQHSVIVRNPSNVVRTNVVHERIGVEDYISKTFHDDAFIKHVLTKTLTEYIEEKAFNGKPTGVDDRTNGESFGYFFDVNDKTPQKVAVIQKFLSDRRKRLNVRFLMNPTFATVRRYSSDQYSIVITSDEKFRNFLNRPSRILIMSITDASHKFPNLKIVK